jgi:NIMA (never in mitosis gene a)-related kinase
LRSERKSLRKRRTRWRLSDRTWRCRLKRWQMRDTSLFEKQVRYVLLCFSALLRPGISGRKDKMPLEEVKNLLARVTESTPSQSRIQERVALDTEFPGPQETPVGRNVMKFPEYIPSAMKGVVLTATGEALATPTPAELANLFVNSPRVGLNFAKIFDFDDEVAAEDSVVDSPPPSPSKRERRKIDTALSSGSTASTSSGGEPSSVSIPPTRLRRPSIRTSIRHPPLNKASTAPIPTAIATGPSTSSDTSQAPPTASKPPILPLAQAQPAPVYDFTDEENLPSPFLKRIDKDRVHAPLPPAKGSIVNRRTSNGNMLRAVAAANSANIHNQGSTRKRTLASTLGSKVPLSAVT